MTSAGKPPAAGAAVLDEDGRVIFWDDEATRIVGVERMEALGRNLFRDLLAGTGTEAFQEPYAKGLRKGSLDMAFDAGPAHCRIRSLTIESRRLGWVLIQEAGGGRRTAGEVRSAETERYRLGTLDNVTGLPNRLFFVDMLKFEMERSRRTKATGTFVMILAGGRWISMAGEERNRVAAAVAGVIRRMIRTTDLVSRLAEDRFGVYLSGTALDGARQFVERIRRTLATTSRALGPAGPIEVCFGLAGAEEAHFRVGTLMQAADRASSQARLLGSGHSAVATPRSVRAL